MAGDPGLLVIATVGLPCTAHYLGSSRSIEWRVQQKWLAETDR